MIVFDLKCGSSDHVFEAWFGSSAEYEDQRTRGLVQCPLCGSLEIEKAVMAPRLGSRPPEPQAPGAPALDAKQAKVLLAEMAAIQKQLLAGSDYVGERFADEARAIYLGETDARSIYGKASEEETRLLHEEGISIARLPFPVVLPGEEN